MSADDHLDGHWTLMGAATVARLGRLQRAWRELNPQPCPECGRV